MTPSNADDCILGPPERDLQALELLAAYNEEAHMPCAAVDLWFNGSTVSSQKIMLPKGAREGRVEYSMWDEAKDGFTGMQRVTAFPAAIGGKPVAGKKIDLTGVHAPEECVRNNDYRSMLDELKLSDIQIKETVSW